MIKVEHIACMEEMRNAYNVLVGKSEGKRPLEFYRINSEVHVF
jgi:hypothetical protein